MWGCVWVGVGVHVDGWVGSYVHACAFVHVCACVYMFSMHVQCVHVCVQLVSYFTKWQVV